MLASAGASASASTSFREKLNEYNKIHEGLKGDPLKDYAHSHFDLFTQIRKATKLSSINITSAVAKKKAFEQLKLGLEGLTSKYDEIVDGTAENNLNLEKLKVSIEEAITVKKVAAAAAKADKDASAAAQAQALTDARNAIQAKIAALNGLIATRNSDFEAALISKNKYVDHMVQEVPNKVKGIKKLLLQGKHISQTTIDMVNGIENDINDFKSKVDFGSISSRFEADHKTELAAIQAQIVALTSAMDGGDINGMLQAVTSTQLSNSTTLGDFIGKANDFIGTLDAKLTELVEAEARVKAAIAKDLEIFQEEEAKIRDLQMIIADFKYAYDKIPDIISEFNQKKEECEKLLTEKKENESRPQIKQMKSMKLDSNITALNTVLQKLENEIGKYLDPRLIIEPLNEIESQRTQRTVNAPVQGKDDFEAKIAEVNTTKKGLTGEYQIYESIQEKNRPDMLRNPPSSASSPSPSTSPSTSPSPSPRPPPAAAAAAADKAPKNAWTSGKLPSLPPSHSELLEMAVNASPDRQSIALVGPIEHFVFIPRNQTGTPSEAYLVEIRDDAGGVSPKSLSSVRSESTGSPGGGSKRKHLQRGGAPPLVVLPSNIEIRIIDAQTPGLFELITGLTPPDKLLRDSSEQIPIHPIIEKIRNRMPVSKEADKTRIYDQIRPYLITKESRNPLVIGRKAVYKVNILKLLTLLDKLLGTDNKYRVIYQELSTFMVYDSTFKILNSLFDVTFGSTERELRSGVPPPSITKVFTEPDIIKIVGWTTINKNVLFDKLFGMFSTCENGSVSKFLLNNGPSSQKNLGSKRNLYYRFRLNWIILLAFHSLYINTSTPENVGLLIDKMHEAFLGWMSREPNIFKQMFTPPDHRNPQNSHIDYSKKVRDIIVREIKGQPLLLTLKTIKDKLCDLEENMALDVEADVAEDDDPDYMPSDNGSGSSIGSGSETGSGSRSSMTSSRPDLSPSGLSDDTNLRRPPPIQPTGRPSIVPILDLQTVNLLSEGSKNPPVTAGFINDSAAAADNRPRHSRIPSPDMPEDVLPDSYGHSATAGGVAALSSGTSTSRPFLHSARPMTPIPQDKWAIRPIPPPTKPGEHSRKQQGIRPSSARSSSEGYGSNVSVQGSSGSEWHTGRGLQSNRVFPESLERPGPNISVQGSQGRAAGSFTDRGLRSNRSNRIVPITDTTDPAHSAANRAVFGTDRLPQTNKEIGVGGSHKKRTRKHKKHISRHPTRRRRIAKPTPPEGHKYTRKHPRT